MIYRRERPRCRTALIRLMKKYDCDIEGLLHHPAMFMSDGLRIQARKMLAESEFKTAKELREDKRRDMINRSVGLIG